MSSSQENYSLRWNNHQNHILQSFDQLLQQNSLVDVTLVCSDRSLRAHKVVLSACSPFFEKVFNDTPCKHPVIVLKDFRGWLVQAIVDFMYRGEISVPQEQLNQLIQAAESLQIRGLIGAVPQSSSIVSLSSPPTESDHENSLKDSSCRDTACLSPMPRRKQARPRRRSGDLELPQDLTNGILITKREHEDPKSDFDDDDDELNEITKRVRHNGACNDDDDDDLTKGHNDDNNNGVADEEDEPAESEEKENQPSDSTEVPENLCLKKSSESSQSAESLIGDKNNNNDAANKKQRASLAQQADFHERFILSLKDLRHLRQRPPNQTFSDILSHLPLSPPPNFHMGGSHDSKDNSQMKNDSDQSDAETPPYLDQLELSHHQQQQQRNSLNSNLEKLSREHHKHQQQLMNNQNPGLPPFPPQFHQGADNPMRGPGGPHHPSSPLSFPNMPSVSALALTPPHMFGLDSPLGLFPHGHGLDPSKMYNPMMDLPEHHPAHHRNLHPDHSNFLKKKLQRPKGQHSAPRGGPPRSWTNAELTEALQHVWNKKMTTSQASRIFGIPYNSLLMYVRGKYGKSLKLEQLRKDCISGPPIELLQMGPTAQAAENKKKDKSGHESQDSDMPMRENSGSQRPSSRRSASTEPDMSSLMSQNPLFNPFQGGFYPDAFPGASSFHGLPLSMLNLLPPEARMQHQAMMPMVLDDDCKSDNGSVQSLEDSLPSTPMNLNREKNGGSSGQMYKN